MNIICKKCGENIFFDTKKKKIKCKNCGKTYNVNSLPEFEVPKNTKIHKTIGCIGG